MGGIFGAICREKIRSSTIREGLKRLYYRGYDGLGIAYIDENNRLVVKKEPGYPDTAWEKLGLPETIPSRIVLGHVRYANRGWPNKNNTHPLLDCTGKIAVVGDGALLDYEKHREELRSRGHRFVSTTDFEILPHYLEEYIEETNSVLEALRRIAFKVKGMYTAVFMIEGDHRFYVIKHGQPFVIGIRRDGSCLYVSSDLPSLYGFAEEALVLDDDQVAAIELDNITVIDVESGQVVERLPRKRIKYQPGVVERAGYPHFMLKEIYEIPYALRQTLVTLLDKYLSLASMIIQGARNVFIIGNGTSLHAGYTSAYYFTDLAGIDVEVISAAEFPYYALDRVKTGSVIIAISQSGETNDVIYSVKQAKRRGAVVVGVTNVVGSQLTLQSNVYLPIGAGPEIAVPATKTFTSTLATLLILASYTGVYSGKLDRSDLKNVYDEIRILSKKLEESLERIDMKTRSIIENNKIIWSNVYVSSSGINYPVALEGALKLKEAAIVHSEGIQLGELRHGPAVLIREGFPVIIIEPYEEEAHELYEKVLVEIKNKYGVIIEITSKNSEKAGAFVIKSVETIKELSPISSVVPLQLLAYRLGVKLGRPIDTPPGLVKAVTT